MTNGSRKHELTDSQLESVMGGQILIVERIEGNIIIAVDENGRTLAIKKNSLPGTVHVGDTILKENNKYEVSRLA